MGKDVLSRRSKKYKRKESYELCPVALNLIVSPWALSFKGGNGWPLVRERMKVLETGAQCRAEEQLSRGWPQGVLGTAPPAGSATGQPAGVSSED